MTPPPLPEQPADHELGAADAPHVLLEYGSYACSHCRSAQAIVRRVLAELGRKVRYVFRHKPLASDPFAVPTAVLAELAGRDGRFWEAHETLMASPIRSQADLEAIAGQLGYSRAALDAALQDASLLARVQAQQDAGRHAGVTTTPTFFVDGVRYDGPWDEISLLEAVEPTVAERVSRMARDFAGWAPVTGFLLALAAAVALVLANSPLAEAAHHLWETELGFNLGAASFSLPLHAWINDFLMSIFFLLVGLEIKRELSIGELSNLRQALLPIAGALGGMIVPALIFVSLTWATPARDGWGIPMATDIAFSLGLLALLGSRVPIALKVFLTALAIVDDLGAIIVIALFYGHGFYLGYALAAAGVFALLLMLNQLGVYTAIPYVLLGAVLWLLVYASGVHATLAGILLAISVPTRPPPNLRGLLAQAEAILRPELDRPSDDDRARFPDHELVEALDTVHGRIESPAHRIERRLEPWSSFLILPIFALANAMIGLSGIQLDAALSAGVVLGLAVGKPLGIVLACWLLVRATTVVLPDGVSWPMILGAGALAGVGFTMSIFIGNEAYTSAALVENAKLAVLVASVISATIGIVVLSRVLPRVRAHSSAGES